MKKLIATLVIALFASSAIAQQHHGGHVHGHWQRHGNGWHWVVPAIIGGAIVYEVTRPPVVTQQPTIIYQNTVINDSNCSPWTEVQNPDGTITRTRTCTQ